MPVAVVKCKQVKSGLNGGQKMRLHNSVINRDFDLYTSLIQSGEDVNQSDEDGNTVLHLIAKNKRTDSVAHSITSMFSSKVESPHDWICATDGRNIAIADLAIVQNKSLDTCMHIAIENENWEFAVLMQQRLCYQLHPDKLRRNKFGLTEYELALVLYGIRGRNNQIDAVFGEMAKVYSSGLGFRYSPFTEEVGIEGGFLALKMAVKAVKMIKLPLKNGNVVNYPLSADHKLFKIANENEYPSPHAEFDDEIHLDALYEAINVPYRVAATRVAAAKKDRDKLRDTIMMELPHLPYDNWLEEDPKFVYSFFEQYAEVLVCKNYHQSQIISTLRELSRGKPMMCESRNCDEIITDLKLAYNADAFLPYSRILEILIAKFTTISCQLKCGTCGK